MTHTHTKNHTKTLISGAFGNSESVGDQFIVLPWIARAGRRIFFFFFFFFCRETENNLESDRSGNWKHDYFLRLTGCIRRLNVAQTYIHLPAIGTQSISGRRRVGPSSHTKAYIYIFFF